MDHTLTACFVYDYLQTVCIRPSRISRLQDYPLHNAAAQGDAAGISHYLLRGWSVTQRDADSFTPIHYAAKYVPCLFVVV